MGGDGGGGHNITTSSAAPTQSPPRPAARPARHRRAPAGDQFQGTTWDYVYTRTGVQVAHEPLNAIGLDAYTLGNHDVRGRSPLGPGVCSCGMRVWLRGARGCSFGGLTVCVFV